MGFPVPKEYKWNDDASTTIVYDNDSEIDGMPNPKLVDGGGSTPTGTINITQNGTVDVSDYASAEVAVPNTYSASDEGKVVSSGALVSQSSQEYTLNGVYDTTLIDEVTVNVGNSLPSDYTQKQYIQSNGDAYIDAIVKELPGFLTSIEGEFQVGNQTTNVDLFGEQTANNQRFMVFVDDSNNLNYYGGENGAGSLNGWVANQFNKIAVSFVDNATYPVFSINDSAPVTGSKKKTTTWTNTGGNHMYVLAQNYQTTGATETDMTVSSRFVRCKYLKISYLGSLIRDYIPCMRNADSVYGFYDLASKTFYPSIGGQAFTGA